MHDSIRYRLDPMGPAAPLTSVTPHSIPSDGIPVSRQLPKRRHRLGS